MKSLFKLTVSFAAMLLAVNIAAQTPSMMTMARAELQKRGLDETEVRIRLMEKGINVDNISPVDYPKYQGAVLATLDELEAEKNPVMWGLAPGDSLSQGSVVAGVESAPLTAVTDTAVGNQPVPEIVPTPLDSNAIYGHNFFKEESLNLFRTTDGAQAPDTYVLGEGDEVHVSIFGASQIELQQRVNSSGFIQPTGAGKIFVKGLTLAKAREAIANSLSSYYSFRRDQISVTIITARTVMVSIFGEVALSGSFSVSALNSAVNALGAAGGPTEIGSVRNIQVIRGNEKNLVDIYAFMKDPNGKMKLDIQNNDIIYVPTSKCVVKVEGGVQRPMRYEMLETETFRDLVDYAGGLVADINMNYLQIERYENGEKKIIEYNLADMLTSSSFHFRNGDIVRMRSISQPMKKYVKIGGGVYYGGIYDLEVNRSLAALLEKAKPTSTAKTDFLFVERTRDDETIEVLTIPFPGVNGNSDFTLQEGDSVAVLDKVDFRDVASISVKGQVRRPFEKDFAIDDKMTVSQAIAYAGGLKESVFPVAYIYRKDIKNPSVMRYIGIDIQNQGDICLQPGDELHVYDNTTFTNIGQVSVLGAVKNPVDLTYDGSMSLKDLLTMAGGLEQGADPSRVEVFRTDLSTSTANVVRLTLEVDSLYNVVSPSGFALAPYDKVVVRLKTDFNLGRTVQISGRVRYPGLYLIENNQVSLSDLINMAGGLMEDADPYGARLFRTYRNRGNVTLNLFDTETGNLYSRGAKLEYDPILMDEDVINISRSENVVSIRANGTRMSQFVAQGYDEEDPLNSIDRKVVVYKGKHNAAWYIRNYAGGFVKTADKNSVTVTYPNNQMVATKKVLGFRKYPTVKPGATISLSISPEKVKKEVEPKQKVDIESALAKGLSTITSTVSLIILISKLN